MTASLFDLNIGLSWWGFRELPPERHFEIATRFGFKTLEFGLGDNCAGALPGDLDAAGVKAWHTRLTTTGIKAPFATLENDFGFGDAAAHRRVVERTLREMDLCAELGATHVRLFATFTPAAQTTEAIWSRMIEAFHTCAERATILKLKIAIETHGRIHLQDGAAIHTHTVSTHPGWLARLLRELPPSVGFNWDPGNLKAVNPTDRRCALDLLNTQISYCHLKDWRRIGAGWEACAIGDDDLDYAPLLRDCQFDGVYLIEYEPTADVEDGIARSLDYLKRIGIRLHFV